jgi:hypothetical protein
VLQRAEPETAEQSRQQYGARDEGQGPGQRCPGFASNGGPGRPAQEEPWVALRRAFDVIADPRPASPDLRWT